MAVYAHPQSPASSLAKPELRPLSSQFGNWEPAQPRLSLAIPIRCMALRLYTLRAKYLV